MLQAAFLRAEMLQTFPCQFAPLRRLLGKSLKKLGNHSDGFGQIDVESATTPPARRSFQL
jgi:hypothetical protein